MMSLPPILIVEIFDVRDIDFRGPLCTSFGFAYIFLAVDYMSKWVEVLATRTNDHKVVVKFVKEYIIYCYGTPRALISEGDSHLCHKSFKALIRKYYVTLK